MVRENCAFLRDAIDIGGPIPHHAMIVGTDVPVTNVVTEDDEDVWLLCLRQGGWNA